MTFCVLSVNIGEKYQNIFANCVQTHEDYTKKWGYGYKLISEHKVQNSHLTFTKFYGAIECFEDGYEWVLFVDSDAIINNQDIPLTYYTDECPCNKDMIVMREIDLKQHCGLFGMLNTGVFIIKNTDWSKNLLKNLIEIGKSHPNKQMYEQDIFNMLLYHHRDLYDNIYIHEWNRKHSINGFLAFRAKTAHKDDFIIHFISFGQDLIHLVHRDETPTLVFHDDEYHKYWEQVIDMTPCLMDWPMHGFN